MALAPSAGCGRRYRRPGAAGYAPACAPGMCAERARRACAPRGR